MTVVQPIKIEGLAQFSRALRKLDNEAPKQLRLVFNSAAQIVVDDAKPHVPRRTGRAASTLKAKSTRTEARVSGGGSRAPYFAWLDFGGRVGKRKSVRRPFVKEGRIIYPAYHRKQRAISALLESGLLKVVSDAGLEVD